MKHSVLFELIFSLFIILLIIPIAGNFLSKGNIDYCYIDSYKNDTNNYIYLYGNRPWRFDARIAKSTDPKKLIDIANKIDCKFK